MLFIFSVNPSITCILHMLGNFLPIFFVPRWQFSNFMGQLMKISIELLALYINHNEELAQTRISWTSAFVSCSFSLSEISMWIITTGFLN